MTCLPWPGDMPPFVQSFWIQPHVERSESPFTRQQKVYELSAPRWVTRLAVRGGYAGYTEQAGFGRRMDALLSRLRGGANRVALWDFRRPGREGWETAAEDFDDDTGYDDGTGNTAELIANAAIAAGATTVTLTGAAGSETAPTYGDYVGGDGRPHLIEDRWVEGSDLVLQVHPAFSSAVAENDASFVRVAGTFRLTSDDQGQNSTEVGGLTLYDAELTEDI